MGPGSKYSKVCFGALFFVCLLPSLFLVFGRGVPLYISGNLILLSFCFLTLVISISGYLPRLVAMLLSLFAILALIEVWMITNYGNTIDSNFLGILVETNSAESLDFFKILPLWLPICILLVIVISSKLVISPIRLNKKSSQIIFLVSVLVLVPDLLFLQYQGRKFKNEFWEGTANETLFMLQSSKEELILRQAYPTGLLFVFQDFLYQRNELKFAIDLHKDFRFGAERNDHSDQRQVYILVIGESSSASHWGLNEYERNTTPLLAARQDIVNFKNMYTFETATRLAVPLIISRKEFYDPRPVTEEATIVSYFKEIGFKTVWVSMQAQYGFNDSPISVSAFEADEVIFMNPATTQFKTKYDYESLPEIKRLIESTNENLFIVLHTLGSHLSYENRYGEEMRVFTPDTYSGLKNLYAFFGHSTMDNADYLAMINAYDNSIVATDFLLANLINLLEEQKNSDTWMFYISDHGQALYDDCTRRVGHGFFSPNVNHIPAVFWASEGYEKKHPERLDALRKHASSDVSSTMMFYTMVGLSGGVIPTDKRVGYDLTQEVIREPDDLLLMKQENLLQAFCNDQ